MNEFEDAMKLYVEDASDTLREVFEKALVRKRSRKYHNTRLILEALALAEPQEITRAEILERIQKRHPRYPSSNLTKYLRELQEEDRGEVIIQNLNSLKYGFSTPFYKVFAAMLFTSEGSVISDDDFARVTLSLDTSELLEAFRNVYSQHAKDSNERNKSKDEQS